MFFNYPSALFSVSPKWWLLVACRDFFFFFELYIWINMELKTTRLLIFVVQADGKLVKEGDGGGEGDEEEEEEGVREDERRKNEKTGCRR